MVLRLFAGEKGFDHTPNALLFQLVRQLVEVGAAGEDEFLAGGVDVLFVDGSRAVAPDLALEARAGAQRVHQPGLASGGRPHGLAGRLRERLLRLGDVLPHQGARLLLRKVAEAQGLGRHVERAAVGECKR